MEPLLSHKLMTSTEYVLSRKIAARCRSYGANRENVGAASCREFTMLVSCGNPIQPAERYWCL